MPLSPLPPTESAGDQLYSIRAARTTDFAFSWTRKSGNCLVWTSSSPSACQVVVSVPEEGPHIQAQVHWFGGETSTLEVLTKRSDRKTPTRR